MAPLERRIHLSSNCSVTICDLHALNHYEDESSSDCPLVLLAQETVGRRDILDQELEVNL